MSCALLFVRSVCSLENMKPHIFEWGVMLGFVGWALADPGGGGAIRPWPLPKPQKGGQHVFWPPPPKLMKVICTSASSRLNTFTLCAMVTYQLIFTK